MKNFFKAILLGMLLSRKKRVVAVLPEFKHTPPPPLVKRPIFKYIIYGAEKRLIMGFSVEYHVQLIPQSGKAELVRGGGRIDVIDETKSILFYHLSTDFGPADKEELIASIKKSIFSPSWEGYTIYHTKYDIMLINEAWDAAKEIYKIEG